MRLRALSPTSRISLREILDDAAFAAYPSAQKPPFACTHARSSSVRMDAWLIADAQKRPASLHEIQGAQYDFTAKEIISPEDSSSIQPILLVPELHRISLRENHLSPPEGSLSQKDSDSAGN